MKKYRRKLPIKKKILIAIIVIIIICVGIGIYLFKSTNSNQKTLGSPPSTSQTSKENTSTKSANTDSNKVAPTVSKLSTNSTHPVATTENNSTSSKNIKATSSNPITNSNSSAYTYATQADLTSISGNYNLTNFTLGANSKPLNEISSITINSQGIALNNDISGVASYSSSEKMKIWKFSAKNFQTTFGTSPTSQGLNGNEFNVYSIGDVFVYQLPNQNILFSFKNIAGTTLNNSNNMIPSNISNWYGTYTVKNKVGQLNGYDSTGVTPSNITGKKLIMTAAEYKYGNVDIQNPKYYLLKVPAQALLGTNYSGATLLNGSVSCIAVLSPRYPMTNYVYQALPPYTGCTSGAWAANVSMPIILGSNGTVQVLNNINQIYSTTKNN